MDDTLKAKLNEARKRLASTQDQINANRRHHDHAVREWARGEQRPANRERAQFRSSFSDDERSQIEDRLQQLVKEYPKLSPVNSEILDTATESPATPAEVLDEYYFLRDIQVE
jgi:chromosome segregation ATPase